MSHCACSGLSTARLSHTHIHTHTHTHRHQHPICLSAQPTQTHTHTHTHTAHLNLASYMQLSCSLQAVCPPTGSCSNIHSNVHSVEQKSIGLKSSKSRTGSDLRYSCHNNSIRFTFPISAHSWRFSVIHSLQSITPRIY